MKLNPLFAVDGYKFSHGPAYPKGTNKLYDVFTPRSDKYFNSPFFKNLDIRSPLIWVGMQTFIQHWLVDEFNENFFGVEKEVAVAEFKEFLDAYFGPDAVSTDNIAGLHDLGYLPLVIKTIPEGCNVDMKVATCTFVNTHDDFAWLVGYLETLVSAELWPAATAATIAMNYKAIGTYWAELTCEAKDHLLFQFHDFSARGDMGMWACSLVGLGHLASFRGTDSVFALKRTMKHYAVPNVPATGYLYGASVPATEHSVMCMGEKVSELETFSRLIQEVYPTGIVSIVSDTWDYWKVITEFLPTLADTINERDGKVVIRPDSGDPIDIICGRLFTDLNGCEHLGHVQTVLMSKPGAVGLYKGTYYEFKRDSEELVVVPEHVVAGSIEMMWRTFGGTINKKGFKVLNPKIGLIYGDSITMERAEEIFARLAAKDFASSNVVLGIGSYTYQYVTRDTFGFAMKATYGEVNGVGREIFKDPATDDGTKKSAKGLLKHAFIDGVWTQTDMASAREEQDTELLTVFKDGVAYPHTDIDVIRQRVDALVDGLVYYRMKKEGLI